MISVGVGESNAAQSLVVKCALTAYQVCRCAGRAFALAGSELTYSSCFSNKYLVSTTCTDEVASLLQYQVPDMYCK